MNHGLERKLADSNPWMVCDDANKFNVEIVSEYTLRYTESCVRISINMNMYFVMVTFLVVF